MEKIVAFDVETARVVPEGESLEDHEPLGISVAALYDRDWQSPRVYYGGCWSYLSRMLPSRLPKYTSPRMNAIECQELVRCLEKLVAKGHTIVGWNSLGFDFRILAQESGLVEECRRLAWGHIDVMFHFFCAKGFAVGLDAVAKGMGLAGKTEGVSGADAPRMWAEGEFSKVMEYVSQDVRTTMEIYDSLRPGVLQWTTKRGGKASWEIPGRRLLRACEAVDLPEPDVSWWTVRCKACGVACDSDAGKCEGCGSVDLMRPWTREKFTGWVDG